MALLSLTDLKHFLKKDLHYATGAGKRAVANTTYENLLDNTYTTVVSAATTLGSTSTAIPALIVPANSVIIDAAAIVTTGITMSSGTVGTKIGTAADGAQLSAAAAASIAGTGTSVAAGVGTHTTAHVNTALQGNAQLTLVAGQAFRSAETEVHFTITSTAAVTAGAVICFVKYTQLV
jgi:hypothetical protein